MITAVIATIVAYILLIVYLGFRANKSSLDTVTDYFLASRTLSSKHLAVTTFATWFSTFAFLGSPGFYYSKGVAWGFGVIFFTLAGLFLLWFIGRKLWLISSQNNYITPAELLVDFYKNKPIGYMVAIISIVSLVPYVLIQVIAIGKVVEGATNSIISYEMAVITAGAVAAFYVFLGGMRAIILTDWIQGALFLAVVIISAGIAIYASGGLITGLQNSVAARPDLFVMDSQNMGFPITIGFSWILGFLLLPHMWQRTYMAKTAKDFAQSIYYQAFIVSIIAVATVIIGVLSIGFVTGLEDSDKLVPTLFATYLPWAVPLLVLTTFAAGMSTTDSQLLTVSSVFTRDIIRPAMTNKLNPHKGKLLGRYLVIVLVAVITVLALLPESQGPIIMLASKGVGLATLLLIPLIGPLYWDKATTSGAISGMLTGFSFQLAHEFNLFEIPYNFGSPIPALLLGLVVFYGVSMLAGSSKKLATAVN